jgi:hypothetical protein
MRAGVLLPHPGGCFAGFPVLLTAYGAKPDSRAGARPFPPRGAPLSVTQPAIQAETPRSVVQEGGKVWRWSSAPMHRAERGASRTQLSPP